MALRSSAERHGWTSSRFAFFGLRPSGRVGQLAPMSLLWRGSARNCLPAVALHTPDVPLRWHWYSESLEHARRYDPFVAVRRNARDSVIAATPSRCAPLPMRVQAVAQPVPPRALHYWHIRNLALLVLVMIEALQYPATGDISDLAFTSGSYTCTYVLMSYPEEDRMTCARPQDE